MSSQLWLRIVGYLNYMLCRYVFISSFISQIEYAEKTGQSDVATYGGISKLYIIHINIYIFFCFTEKLRGTKTRQSDVATYGERIHIYIFFRVHFEQSTVATYGGISKLFIIHIRFYLFFCFTDKVRRTKTEHSDVATYGGRIHIHIYSRVQLFG